MSFLKKASVLALYAACGGLQARTVALWPLETDTKNNFDGRCVIDPGFDLQVVNRAFVDSDIGWNLPPNPDAAPHAWEPLNAKAIQQVYTGKEGNGFLWNNNVGVYLSRDRAFTVEGWIKLTDIPARDTWSCVLAGYNESAHKNRWTLSLRRRPDENYACSWIVWAQGGSDKVLHAYSSEEESYNLTNKWMHIAFTHTPLTNGKDNWTLFIDGVQAGTTQSENGVLPAAPEYPRQFDIGARRGTSHNPTPAVFDYWRVSDEVLTPDQFLCAGGAGSTVAKSHTVAYWPLEATADGGVDGRDAVGDAPLTSGFHGTTARYNRMSPSASCAFAGNPPNTTVTLPNGNTGSLQGTQSSGCLRQDAVGPFLNLAADFTVEGWFAPRLCERTTKTETPEPAAYLFGTRPDYDKGWVLAYRAKSATDILFDIYCIDQTGNIKNNVKLSGSYPVYKWYEAWHHLALVYDADGGANGYGLWSLYIDGEVVGESANPRQADPVQSARVFILGGREQIAEQSFQGGIDCVRVSQAALRPTQFLCAADGAEAATDVLALWPLNVEGGAYLDLRDVSGNNRHFASRDSAWAYQKAVGDLTTPGPAIRNPDRSRTFRGSRTKTVGSVRFRNPDAATDTHRAYLETGNNEVMWTFKGGRDFTFEFYYMRRACAKNVSGDQEVVFVVTDGTSAKMRFFRKNDGFYIWENVNGNLADTKFAGTATTDLAADTWYHFGLVHTIEEVDGAKKTAWRLYKDGELLGTASVNYSNGTSDWPTLLVGGRYWSDRNSVVGNLSSVRLSDCALDPSEFLCAEPATPVDAAAATAAYWPIDGGDAGLANRVDAWTPLTASGEAAAQDDKAVASIPNAEAEKQLTGAARRNAGSYALAGGSLAAPSVGHLLSFANAFTVEGWIKWTPSETTAEEDLFGAGETDSGLGVRVYLDKTGAQPHLRVFAREAWPATPIVDAAFDADLVPYAGVWTHVAVTYDPCEGTGTWKLYADGKQLGSAVSNFYRANGTGFFRSGDFRIGGTTEARALNASVDMWRVSAGVRDAKQFLWDLPRGFMLFIR